MFDPGPVKLTVSEIIFNPPIYIFDPGPPEQNTAQLQEKWIYPTIIWPPQSKQICQTCKRPKDNHCPECGRFKDENSLKEKPVWIIDINEMINRNLIHNSISF